MTSTNFRIKTLSNQQKIAVKVEVSNMVKVDKKNSGAAWFQQVSINIPTLASAYRSIRLGKAGAI